MLSFLSFVSFACIRIIYGIFVIFLLLFPVIGIIAEIVLEFSAISLKSNELLLLPLQCTDSFCCTLLNVSAVHLFRYRTGCFAGEINSSLNTAA